MCGYIVYHPLTHGAAHIANTHLCFMRLLASLGTFMAPIKYRNRHSSARALVRARCCCAAVVAWLLVELLLMKYNRIMP